jgi:hypothetical protein
VTGDMFDTDYKLQSSSLCSSLHLPVPPAVMNTNSTEWSPSWEDDKLSWSRTSPLHLCNPKFYYPVDKNPPLLSILSLMDPAHIPSSDFCKIPFTSEPS